MKTLLITLSLAVMITAIPAMSWSPNPWQEVTGVPTALNDVWNTKVPRLVMDNDMDGNVYMVTRCNWQETGPPASGGMVWEYDPTGDTFTLVGSNVFTTYSNPIYAHGEGGPSFGKGEDVIAAAAHGPFFNWGIFCLDLQNVSGASFFDQGPRFGVEDGELQVNPFDVWNVVRNDSGYVTSLYVAAMARGDSAGPFTDALYVLRVAPEVVTDIPQINGNGTVEIISSGNPPNEEHAYPSVGVSYGGKFYTIGGNHSQQDGWGSTNIYCWPTPKAGQAAFTNYLVATIPEARAVGRENTVSLALAPASETGAAYDMIWVSYYNESNERKVAVFNVDTGALVTYVDLPTTLEPNFMGSLALVGNDVYVGLEGSLKLNKTALVPEPALLSVLAGFALLFFRRK